mmetsp:Transcript_47704/g.144245  ORF Transcript_47704/g.144245 Transcript_47704/m.144245 type:complete len:782 (-) Transcript_47704:95-2440(-)
MTRTTKTRAAAAEEEREEEEAAAAEEPSPYASIIRERFLRQQAAERAREEAIATKEREDDDDGDDGADDDGINNNANRERAESAPESLGIEIEDSTRPRGRGSRGEDWDDDDDDDDEAREGGAEDEIDDGDGRRFDRYSLALSPSTSCAARLLVPLFILLAHALFVYGQLAPMWRLRLFAHVDVWANATQPVARRTVEALGLPWRNQFKYDHDGDVETFTYGFAVRRLWEAKGMPSTFGPRLSAVLLVLFSGAWPHIKLILLHLNFWVRRRAEARTGALYWLSGFGKWSLADVLVVCVMIAVVHLDWEVDPGAIRDGVSRELQVLVNIAKKMYTPTEACDQLLHQPCSEHESIKCWTCVRALSIMFDHPDWAQGAGQDVLRGFETSGGGQASLRIAGMKGIYVFCAAATLSLLIGVVVDWLDHKARRHRAQTLGAPEAMVTVTFEDDVPEQTGGGGSSSPPHSASRRSQRSRGAGSGGGAGASALRHGTHSLSARGPTMHLLNRVPSGSPFSSEHSYTLLFFASLFAVVLAVLSVARPTMERRVYGAIPKLLNEILGVQWHRKFSLLTLTEVTGDAGGPDYLLLATFALFVVVGPVLRVALCALTLAPPLSERAHERLTYAINVLGAFCAWDVLGVAAFMVMLEMPSITDTILVRDECALVPDDAGESSGGQCLEVQFNLLNSFYWLVLLGGAILLAVSVAAVRMGMRATDPYGDGDEGGPYLCGCFLRGGCCRPGRKPRGGAGCCGRRNRRIGRRRRERGNGAGARAYSLLGDGEDGRIV